MRSKSDQEKLRAIVEQAGGHVILLDELCNAVIRYLDNHPLLTLADLHVTVRFFEQVMTRHTTEKVRHE